MLLKKSNFFSSVIVVISVAIIIALPLIRYYSLHSNVFDFGILIHTIYTANIYDLGIHFQPVILIFKFISQCFSSDVFPYVLILLQSTFICFFLTYIYSKYGFHYFLVAILNPVLWGLLMTDVHLDFLFILLFLTYEYRNYYYNYFLYIFLFLVKEIFLVVLFIKFYFHRYLSNIYLNIFFLFILLAAFIYLKNTLHTHLLDLINLNFLNYESIFQFVKLIIILFLPSMFIQFRFPKYFVTTFAVLLIYFLFGRQELLSLNNHYLFLIYVSYTYDLFFIYSNYDRLGYKRVTLSNFKTYLIISLLLVNILFSSSPISRIFWSDKFLNNNYSKYTVDKNAIDSKKNILVQYIQDDNASVSTQNNVFLAFLSERANFTAFPYGVFNFTRYDLADVEFIPNPSDYVILDESKPLFLGDKTCYIHQSCYQEFSHFYNKLVSLLLTKYTILYSDSGFNIFKRND